MPILSGLLFAASMTTAMQDDLIHDKQYVVVKNNEQGTSTGKGSSFSESKPTVVPTTEFQAREVPIRPDQASEVPRLSELPIVGNLFASNGSSDQLRRLPEFKKEVSCSFVDASATDVLRWISKQGVNFASSSDSMPKGRLSLNLKNVPLHEALDAIGEVFGGYWSLRGKTLVFRAGRSFGISTGAPFDSRNPVASRVDPKRPYLLTLPGMSAMPAIPPVGADGFGFTIDEKSFRELAKLHELPPGLSQEERSKMHKELAAVREEMVKSAREVERVREVDVRKSILDVERAKKDIEKTREEMKKAEHSHREASAHLKDLGERMKKLMASLTPAQWDLHKKQGHLLFNELTKEQQKLVATDGKFKGNMMVTNADGKTLTIKN